jgi:hypothetical protein
MHVHSLKVMWRMQTTIVMGCEIVAGSAMVQPSLIVKTPQGYHNPVCGASLCAAGFTARCVWSILSDFVAYHLIRACPPTGELGRIATASVVERGNSIALECVVLDILGCMLRMLQAIAAYHQKLTAATSATGVES